MLQYLDETIFRGITSLIFNVLPLADNVANLRHNIKTIMAAIVNIIYSVSAVNIIYSVREVKLHVYFSRERQKGNFYRLPFYIAQYVKVSCFVFDVSQ